MDANNLNYVRRPLKRVSRKRYAEALRCLKDACASSKLSMTKRLRAAELIMLIYGIETTAPNRHDRKSVKALVSENRFERTLREEVREGLMSQTRREAKQEAARWLERFKAEETAKAQADKQQEQEQKISRETEDSERTEGN